MFAYGKQIFMLFHHLKKIPRISPRYLIGCIITQRSQ